MSSLGQDLLPGISDDVTLTIIATKLPWIAFHILSSVSRKWQQTIQQRQVYTERIRCQSTETLVVVKHLDPTLPQSNRNWISLCSMKEKVSYKLPPIPHFENGISKYSQFVSMDGKLFVLGAGSSHQLGSEENMPVYVLDLAGQSPWKLCRSMPEPEGGYKFNIGHGFTVGAKSIFVAGSDNWYKSFWQESCDISVPAEWRVGGLPARSAGQGGLWFIVQEKIYWMSTGQLGKTHKIEAYDASTNSVTHQHSISWEAIIPEIAAALPQSPLPFHLFPRYILPTNNELFLVALWTKDYEQDHGWIRCHGFCLLQSKGFGTVSKDIVWEKTGSPSRLHFDSNPDTAICPIQL